MRAAPIVALFAAAVTGYIAGVMAAFAIFLMIAAMVITLGIVFTGIFAMARGGEFNNKWANKLMRARVVMQGVALLMFILSVYLLKQGG